MLNWGLGAWLNYVNLQVVVFPNHLKVLHQIRVQLASPSACEWNKTKTTTQHPDSIAHATEGGK